MKIMRDLEDGNTKFAWVNVNNPWQNTANANHWLSGTTILLGVLCSIAARPPRGSSLQAGKKDLGAERKGA